jgi:hypothetical protein
VRFEAKPAQQPYRALQLITTIALFREAHFSMGDSTPPRTTCLRISHEILTSLNLAFALALAMTLAIERRSELHIARTGAHDIFRELLLRINLFFYHQAALAPLAIDTVLAALTFTLFLLSLLALRLLARAGPMQAVLGPVAGIAALAAVPVTWVFHRPGYVGMWTLPLYFAVIGGALYLTRRRASPSWCVVVTVHYAVFAWVLSHWPTPDSGIWPDRPLNLLSMWPMLFSLISPCAGFVWVLYFLSKSKQPPVAPARPTAQRV